MEKSEGIGLAIAATGHLALLGILSIPLLWPDDIQPVSPTITVQLSDEIGLEAATPTPAIETAPSEAPEIGEIDPDATISEPLDRTVEPDTVRPSPPIPLPRPSTRPAAERPKKVERTPAKPAPKAEPKPAPAKEPRASRLGDDFLKGTGSADSDSTDPNPVAKASAAQVAALNSIIANQIKPHWTAPTGADADLLVTRVSWSLSSNGSLTGSMSCRQVGKVTPSNSPQVDLHCERAKAAIKRAAPFSSLPDKFYDEWKSVVFNFDRRT